MIGLSAVIGFASLCALVGALGMAYLAGLNAGPQHIVVEVPSGVTVNLRGRVHVGDGVFVPMPARRKMEV